MPRVSPFPPFGLEEALVIARTICEQNAGKPMRRLTIFDVLNRSPESSTSRSLVTASSGYGLTQGGYTSEVITLTERGRTIVELNDPQAMLDAILGVPVFAEFFEHYRNSMVPSMAAVIDFLKKYEVTDQAARTCFDMILKNGEKVELIQEISGTKRIVSPDHALEKLAQLSGALSKPSTLTSAETNTSPLSTSIPESRPKELGVTGSAGSSIIPSVHIDIQIHISADAKPEQIDQVFASMAKHLYKKE